MWLKNIFHAEKTDVLNSERRNTDGIGISPDALRLLNRLQLNSSRYLPGRSSGVRQSVRLKPAYDFRDHRKYVPGDDIRFIDWKVSARHEHVFIRQGEQPKDIATYIFIDTSDSMDWGVPSKRVFSLNLAAVLGFLVLANGDRLSLFSFNQQLGQRLGPITGKGQIPKMLSFIRELSFGGRSDLRKTISEFINLSPYHGLILIISDLLDETQFSTALSYLPVPSWDVVLLQVLHPEEINPVRQGRFEVVDIETGNSINYDLNAQALLAYQDHFNRWQKDVAQICEQNNVFHTVLPSDWSIGQDVLAHLQMVHIVSPR